MLKKESDNSLNILPKNKGSKANPLHSKGNAFFIAEAVGESWREPIEIRFDALLKERGLKWVEIYKPLGIDKADASRIRRGLVIPSLTLRIKIAKAFGVDTSVIWKPSDIDYNNYLKLLREENEGN